MEVATQIQTGNLVASLSLSFSFIPPCGRLTLMVPEGVLQSRPIRPQTHHHMNVTQPFRIQGIQTPE
jgi:hypothetical protein